MINPLHAVPGYISRPTNEWERKKKRLVSAAEEVYPQGEHRQKDQSGIKLEKVDVDDVGVTLPDVEQDTYHGHTEKPETVVYTDPRKKAPKYG